MQTITILSQKNYCLNITKLTLRICKNNTRTPKMTKHQHVQLPQSPKWFPKKKKKNKKVALQFLSFIYSFGRYSF